MARQDDRVERLLGEAFDERIPDGRWLVAGGSAVMGIADRISASDRWVHMATDGPHPTPSPPDGPFDGIIVRMPRGAERARMTLHLLAAKLAPTGQLVAASANDEGARSLEGKLAEVFQELSPPEVGHHARRFVASQPHEPRGSLDDWKSEVTIDERSYATWPGLFAHGRLDHATALLL